MAMDKKKITAALALIPAFAWLVGWGKPEYFLALALPLGALLGAYELGRLTMPGRTFEQALLVVMSGFACAASQTGEMEIAAGALCAVVILTLTSVMFRERELGLIFDRTAKIVFGAVYVGFLVGIVVAIKRLEPGLGNTKLLMMLFALTWAGDAGAFFAGSLWGKRKLWPAVSAGKTWEGLVGGFASTIAFALAIAAISNVWIWQDGLILGAVIGVFGPIGDLVESAIKRGANVKDSGMFLPGHGGVLDRIDSILFTAPIVYYYALLNGPLRVAAP
ncbi:MAG: phosphatidate cytidylyltransferase [Deltaproteobacteria bacterium]|nr:phosphatidate cytidylyltransferase [Deltaproteobacteria bacterium]